MLLSWLEALAAGPLDVGASSLVHGLAPDYHGQAFIRTSLTWVIGLLFLRATHPANKSRRSRMADLTLSRLFFVYFEVEMYTNTSYIRCDS